MERASQNNEAEGMEDENCKVKDEGGSQSERE